MIILEANYAKKLGLPGYSSHQYSVSIRTELTDLTRVEQESSRLYGLLQNSVDHSIQHVGFLPDPATYGSASNGAASHETNGRNGHQETTHDGSTNGVWNCSEKQRDFILKLTEEYHLDKSQVEARAVEMFGVGVRQLNKLQASGLIEDIINSNVQLPQRGRANGGTAKRNGATTRRAVVKGGAR